MTGPLKLLLVEDVDDDAALVVSVLRRSGCEVRAERVDTIAGLRAAFRKERWDVVLADYSLPEFDAHATLKAVREYDGDLPVIVVSGTIGEEKAAALMQEGAADVLLKTSLSRLAPVIQREIGVASERRARRQSEEQLRQVQKMEAIGQLTGGIAHDFNNLLTVVIGNLERLAERVAGQADLAELVTSIEAAANSGVELTQRLLASSRQQVLRPAKTDLNELVMRMLGLLRRVLSEDIEIKTALIDELWPAVVDAAQVESALLNLAVNARDAMPDGGTLLIRTINAALGDEAMAAYGFEAPSGDYVVLSVTDTGVGMSQEVLQRAFEPFFTTKGIGKGTGLGLSMVYGFSKQSGGFVEIDSGLGQGTTVKLYLPRASQVRLANDKAEQADIPPSKGNEKILVVEDDKLVRAYVVLRLGDLGYRILEAADGEAALALMRAEGDVDLLFTDVILTRSMNGRQLADAAKQLQPSLKVLFTSGYTQEAIIDQGKLAPGVTLLSKPYKKDDLVRALRHIFGAATPA